MSTIVNVPPRDDPNAVSEISFDSVVPGSVVRQIIIDGKQYLAIKDAIKVICNKNSNRACETWRLLSPDLKEELKEHLNTFNFPGSGGEMPDVITFQGLIILSMYLPGPHAKRNRTAIAVIVHRYFAGDKRLIEEIIKNSESTEPAALMARNELVQGGASLTTAEQELRSFNADLELKQGQVALLTQQEKLLAQQEKLLAQQGALLQQQTTKIELENFEKRQKLLREVDAEILAITNNPGMSGAEKSTAQKRLKNAYSHMDVSKLLSDTRGSVTPYLKQILGFLLVFLQESPIDSKSTSVLASKFFEAYKAYEAAFKQPLELTITRFGREVGTIQGVSKRRISVGWIYFLDHAQIRAHVAV
jgi:hypothetical protein